jgi:hypothetical protein
MGSDNARLWGPIVSRARPDGCFEWPTYQWHSRADSGSDGSLPLGPSASLSHGGRSSRECGWSRGPLINGSAGWNGIDSDWIDTDLDYSLPHGASSREHGRPRPRRWSAGPVRSGLDGNLTRGALFRECGRQRCPLTSGSAWPD